MASGIALAGRGVAGGNQPPKCFSSTGRIASRVVSPTTMSVTLSGRSQSRWNPSRSSRVMAAIAVSVPEPENGMAYGCPAP